MKKNKINLPMNNTNPSMSLRSLYAYFMIPINRKIMLDKINKGLKKEYKDLPDFDKTEDEISKDVLTNWKNLDKKSRFEYCQYILDNSIKGQVWAYSHVEELKQKFKSKISILKNQFNKK